MITKPTNEDLKQRVKELQKVVADLQKSEEDYRSVIDHTNDMISITTFNLKPKYTYNSPSVKKIMGYEPKDLIGMPVFDIIHPDDKKNLLPLLKKYLKAKAKMAFGKKSLDFTERVEYRVKDKSGNWHYLQSTGNLIGNKILFISRDITENKETEEKLKTSEEVYRALTENAPLGIYYNDFSGNFMYGNRKAEEIIGYKSEELIGKNFLKLNLLQFKDIGKVTKLLALNKLGKGTGPDEFVLNRKDGSKVDAEINTEIITIAGKKVVLGMVQDITKRKRAVEDLHESEEKYRKLISEMINGFALHEIILDKAGRPCDYRFLEVNFAFEAMTGLKAADIVGKTAREVTPELEPFWIETYGEVALTGKPVRFEHFSNPLKRYYEVLAYSPQKDQFATVFTDITSRKQAEQALRSEKDKLQALMDGLARTGIGIDIIGSDYTILFQNQMLQQRFGDVTGQLCYEKYMGREKPCDSCPVVGAIKSNKIESVQLTGADGRDYELFSASLPNPDGTVDRVIEVVLDITDRKHAEESLQKSEEKYRDLFQNVSDLLCVHDLDGNLIENNVAWKSKYGFTEEDLANLNLRELMPKRYRNQFKDYLQRVKKNGKDEGFLRIITKDGSERIIEYKNSLIYGPTGPIGVRGSARDMTSRMQIEKALKESEEKYRTLSEQSTDAIYITTRQGKLIYINRSFLDLFGYTKEEVEDLKAQDFYVNPKDRSRYQHAVELTGSVRDFEVKLRKKDNTVIDCLITANTRTADDGSIIEYQGIIRDITEKKNLEAQLLQAQKMESIGTLAGGIAHNFNNLLMSIQGNASLMLVDTPTNHPYYENLSNIEHLVKSGSKLTSQLLGYAREGRFEVKPININRLITDMVETFSMARKNITIHKELGNNLSGVDADASQIEQVLLNIYVNAAEAMPHGGDLFITTQTIAHTDIQGTSFTVKPGIYSLITLRDTGIGMDKATQAKIFDPFFTTKGLAKGTGLGLASVYGIIKAHGGYIDVESNKGHGSTFYIYLPASKGEGIAQRAVRGKPMEIAQGKETVLIVDDEEMVVHVGEQILKKLGYNVLTANSGKEAVYTYKASQDKIDIVILDMIMPGMGGGETYDRMREISPTIKVLLSSGYSINGEATEILQRGCDGFIQKPFTMKELSAAIREVLDKA